MKANEIEIYKEQEKTSVDSKVEKPKNSKSKITNWLLQGYKNHTYKYNGLYYQHITNTDNKDQKSFSVETWKRDFCSLAKVFDDEYEMTKVLALATMRIITATHKYYNIISLCLPLDAKKRVRQNYYPYLS